MPLNKRYEPTQAEPQLQQMWQAEGIYHFQREDRTRAIYSIDTPPPTVSGHLHLGHVYSYSHPDFIARYRRMRGENVFYPMGFDDNGLPTERFVEKQLKVSAQQIGRQAFIEKCLEVSVEEEKNYRALWQRLGLSIDWRYSYRTIDEHSRRCSQHSFLDLMRKGFVYRAQAPMIWCPECHTAIAQADLEDLERTSEFVTLPFIRENGEALPIATTRPELLAACMAVFVHPEDPRYQSALGGQVRVPLYRQSVPVLADPAADPQKGTGAVMCCTFGDQTDMAWWYAHKLPLVEAIGEDGRMLAVTNLPGLALEGLKVEEARKQIKAALDAQGLIQNRQPTTGMIRAHERCDTPVEFIVTRQWFIRLLENKQKFLELGEQVRWHPAHMQARYQAWVENLSWDWCISRQRYFGVPFPVWYCKSCGELILANEADLPVDPLTQDPGKPCSRCGGTEFTPEEDVMDTWATSSISPEIVSGWLDDPQLFDLLNPLTLRPQASEIIRTWAFYTIVKSWYHFGRLPWTDVLISGWGLAGEGMAKISKSKGGGPLPPLEIIQRYSADAVRYWAASTSPGKDAIISEEKIQMGTRLITKLWNVARFAEPFVSGSMLSPDPVSYSPADRWILAGLSALITRVTAAFEAYEYASAKAEIETFFWRDLADNYIEMAKQRLYDPAHPAHAAACQALRQILKGLLQVLAPLLPFVTDVIWRELFAQSEGVASIHNSCWPRAGAFNEADHALGELLVEIATAARRYKSEHALSLGSELNRLQIASPDENLAARLRLAAADLMSVSRARRVEVVSTLEPGLIPIAVEGLAAGIEV